MMVNLVDSIYLKDILHLLSQALLAPVMACLLAAVAYGLWCIGSILVEAFTERRNYRVEMPPFLDALSRAAQDELPATVVESGLLNRQKQALLTLYDYRTLPKEAFEALAKKLVLAEEAYYRHIVGRTDTMSKIAPMFGLMGTLIPLGPGIVALGQGDTTTLSSSLLIAFDTTVAGLIAAAVCFIVSKIRKGWYEGYIDALEAAMTTVTEKVADMQRDGLITISEPMDYVNDWRVAEPDSATRRRSLFGHREKNDIGTIPSAQGRGE